VATHFSRLLRHAWVLFDFTTLIIFSEAYRFYVNYLDNSENFMLKSFFQSCTDILTSPDISIPVGYPCQHIMACLKVADGGDGLQV
jgi:predicted nucleic acid-binding Zn finger protein